MCPSVTMYTAPQTRPPRAFCLQVREYVESLDKGSELVASFVNPASNLLNWVVILSAGVWLATALGFNLQVG